MVNYWLKSDQIKFSIYIPKFYDPSILSELEILNDEYDLYRISELEEAGIISVTTGHEIGKSAYGTGDIPFIRTSDISNWEIKTTPKQGVSEEIFQEYASSQDVQEGDVLLVRDGTYLIGTNCFITRLEKQVLYQSHILKIRIKDKEKINPLIFFIALNTSLVQKQIRSKQFTADIIDTIGNRYKELVVPIIKSKETQIELANRVYHLLEERVIGKTFIKACPMLIEKTLKENSLGPLNSFFNLSVEELSEILTHDTIRSEFGGFEAFWKSSKEIKNNIYLPKYYEPSIEEELSSLEENCQLISLGKLKELEIVDYYTGDEIGKMAYGTGTIPFIRTSDFANWEIKHDPKQGISEEIYEQYRESENVKIHDILLVRDGTYLVGSSCIITEKDEKSLFCGGLYKISVKEQDLIDPWLLLGLLNSYIVKRQIRTKQFTRDVIDTIGNRLDEVILPIPMDEKIRKGISEAIKRNVYKRVNARDELKKIIDFYLPIEVS